MKTPVILRASLWGASVVAAFIAGKVLTQGPPAGGGDPSSPSRQEARDTTPRLSPSGFPSLQSHDPAAVLTAAERLVTSGSISDLESAIHELAESWRPGASAPVLQLCLEAWGHEGGAGAVEQFQAAEHAPDFESWALPHLLAGWTSADPDGALAWVSGSSRSGDAAHSGAVAAVYQAAARNGHLDQALGAASQLSTAVAQTAAAEAIVRGASGHPGDPVATWLANAPGDNPLARRIVTPLARERFKRSPQDSATWAAALASPQNQLAAVREVSRLWAGRTPQEAAAWAQDLPPGDTRSTALSEVVKTWAPEDPQAAGEWLNSIPPSADDDRPLASYIHEIAVSHPEIAAEWAESISDSHARFAAIMRVSNVWQKSDRAAALRWRSASLSRP